MQLAETAKAQFAGQEYSDHIAVIRAYEGWKEAEKEQAGYEYCWKNFLSAQTLKAIHSLRKQFLYLLKDAGLVDQNVENCNKWSHDEHFVRAVICAGLFPGICSVVVSFAAFHSTICSVVVVVAAAAGYASLLTYIYKKELSGQCLTVYPSFQIIRLFF